jgi:histidine triad (HIT) family protein
MLYSGLGSASFYPEAGIHFFNMEAYTGNDIYCDRIIPRTVEVDVIKETEDVLAFHHTRPHWATHIIVIPKKHIPSLIDLATDSSGIATELLDTVAEIAKTVEKEEGGCTIFTTIGDNQQSKHLHIHIHNGAENT